MEIVEPELNGWRRIKDFVHDPKVDAYLVIPVGRPHDVARFKDGKFVDYWHDDWELDVLYWMPIPKEPQELIQWFYGEPNGYRLRTQPPWESEETWNMVLEREQKEKELLERLHPVGSTVTFKSRHFEGKHTGVVSSADAGLYVVEVEPNKSWCVEPEEIIA